MNGRRKRATWHLRHIGTSLAPCTGICQSRDCWSGPSYFAFRGLVYAQIWEDPEVDMDALAITGDCHVVTIASGECNVLSPAKIKGFPVVGHGIAARDSSLRWDDGTRA